MQYTTYPCPYHIFLQLWNYTMPSLILVPTVRGRIRGPIFLAVGRTLELGQDAFALLDAADNGWVIAVSQLDGCQSLAVEPRDLLRDGVP